MKTHKWADVMASRLTPEQIAASRQRADEECLK